ncbi:MAG: YjjG family noncanonical pyrimidine nucleotidase [Bacteroidales bacterium]|nr:YjjG family noncanonical pyrimidine nucleotidase [Bacteroidales bacterium]
MKYKHIFFDLDRTIWDFDANSLETIQEIFTKHKLIRYSTFNDFHKIYREINDNLWRDYRDNKITKDELSWQRFYLTNKYFGNINESLSKSMSKDYISISPTKTQMLPNAIPTLEYLQKKYKLHIITNGFTDVQYNKLENCGIKKYFNSIFTSEEVGCNKPNTKFFNYSLLKTGANTSNSIVIGDDIEVDIKGASAVGIDTIWFNPNNKKTIFNSSFEIKSLEELKNIL